MGKTPTLRIMKKVVILILIITLVGVGLFLIFDKGDEEETKEVKPQKVEQDKNEGKEKENKLVKKAQKQLSKNGWVGTNKLGDEVEIYFNGDTQTIEQTLTNEYTTEENSIDYTISEDGKKIIMYDKAFPFVIKGEYLYFDGIKYSAESFSEPEFSQVE